MEAIKNQIEQTAKELGINEVEMIQKMQAVLVERGDEKGILELHVLKMEYAKKLKLI